MAISAYAPMGGLQGLGSGLARTFMETGLRTGESMKQGYGALGAGIEAGAESVNRSLAERADRKFKSAMWKAQRAHELKVADVQAKAYTQAMAEQAKMMQAIADRQIEELRQQRAADQRIADVMMQNRVIGWGAQPGEFASRLGVPSQEELASAYQRGLMISGGDPVAAARYVEQTVRPGNVDIVGGLIPQGQQAEPQAPLMTPLQTAERDFAASREAAARADEARRMSMPWYLRPNRVSVGRQLGATPGLGGL